MSKYRKHLLVGGCVLALLTLLSETGIIEISWHSMTLAGRYEGGFDSQRYYQNTRGDLKFTYGRSQVSRDFAHTLRRTQFAIASAQSTTAADERVQTTADGSSGVVITDANVDLDGLLWTPLLKSGMATFHVSYAYRSVDGTTAVGGVQGTSAVSVVGLCSMPTLRDAVTNTVLADVVRAVEAQRSK